MLLHQCISATIFQKVSKATTTKEVWDILQDDYGNSSKVKKIRLQSLQRQYELLCMGEQETVVEYIGRIQVVVNAMRAWNKRLIKRKNTEKSVTPSTNQALQARNNQTFKGRGRGRGRSRGGRNGGRSTKSSDQNNKTMEVSRRMEEVKGVDILEVEAERAMIKETFNVSRAANMTTILRNVGTMKMRRETRMVKQQILHKKQAILNLIMSF
ncbi:uncharacterized protein LOC108324426 [Vigna angularis]|uniref:uncharacterized protein LOC108324426 n=1 Tax=Phaseolus angularis TaxID=3914 RepID=UPI000809F583|nr:uncharacterized protein LOC108324426 [Vigna angularis]